MAICLSEAGYKIATILLSVEVEQVVVDLDPVADEFDGVSAGQVVVVNVKGASALGNRAPGVLRDRNIANDCAADRFDCWSASRQALAE